VEPLSLPEVKPHLRLDLTFTDDDVYIGALIKVAREYCEKYQSRTYITQTFDLYLDEFPNELERYRALGELRERNYRPFTDFHQMAIKLKRPPLQSVTSVKYYDQYGVANTLDPSAYIVDLVSEPGRILPAYGLTWPTTLLQPVNGVAVRYVAGYGDDATTVPQGVKQSMLMLIGYWYENREAATLEKGVSQRLEFAIDALLGQERVVNV
jgi:uncharacterized phiE125 gp8 family phage protein